jgi:hypothetical protein
VFAYINERGVLKMEKKLLEKYCDNLVKTLVNWALDASNLKAKVSAASGIIPIDLYDILRKINSKLQAFRADLKNSYASYRDLEDVYGLEPLSLAYLMKYSILVKEIEDSLGQVKDVAEKYARIIEMSKEYGVDINKYVSAKNQKSIERIQALTTEKLLDIMNDIDLFDF